MREIATSIPADAGMDHREVLQTLFRCYCWHTKRSEARISTLVFNHGGRIAGIQAGRDFTVGSYERALRWFSAHWPDGLPWPEEIPRPSPTSRVAAPGTGRAAPAAKSPTSPRE